MPVPPAFTAKRYVVRVTNRYLATVALVSLLLLTGCAGAAPQSPPDAFDEDGLPVPAEEATIEGSPLEAITSCDQVEAAVAPYIDGLVPDPGNTVDEWGVSCTWEMAEDETDFANNRSVKVGIGAVAEGTPKPDASGIADMEGGSVLEDAWVSERDGVAFSLTMGTAVAGVTVTTVWLPGAEAMITGGTWGDLPALDGPAAIEVVKTLLPNG